MNSMYGGDLAFFVVASAALALAVVASHVLRRRWPPALLVLGVLLRMVGSWVHYEVVLNRYSGQADAVRYFRNGLVYRDRLLSWDLTGFVADLFSGDRWWGTPFVDWVSGLVLWIVGPDLKAEFLVFSLLAFTGLFALAEAVRRLGDTRRAHQYAACLFLWPSLWFWPSTVGKEALVLLGLGILVLAYAGRAGKPSWGWLVAGWGLIFACRPHVAVIVLVGLVMAYLLRPAVRLSAVRMAQLAGMVLLIWAAFLAMANLFGVEESYRQDLGQFVERRAESTLRGGSQLETTPLQEGKPWLALVNFWLRPFAWEVDGVAGLFAALEVVAFWLLVLLTRRGVWSRLRHWRRDPLLRLALPALLIYSLVLGSVVGNLGILVRQRTVILPLAFLFIAGGWRWRRGRETHAAPRPGWSSR